MALSYIESYGTAGGQTDFFYSSLSLLSDTLVPIESQLRVFVNGTQLTLTTDYTVDIPNGKIILNTAVYSSDLVRIARFTQDTARYINYTDATNITAQILNTDATQLFFLVQEAKDLQTDAMIVGIDGKWNAQSRQIGNLSAGVDSDDAVTVAQLAAATAGASPASLGGYGYQSLTGDGTTFTFALNAAIATITDSEDIEVFIQGVRQKPGSAYNISAGNIVFSSPPAGSSNIDIFWVQGTVAGVLTDSSIETANLQPQCVTESKIGSGAASSEKVLKADGSGGASFSQITSSSVSDFDTQVRTSRLDQMAAPTASVSLNSQKITNLATPTAATDAASKSYVDAKVYSQTIQPACSGSGSPVSGSLYNSVNVSGTFTNLTNLGCVHFRIPMNRVGGGGGDRRWISGTIVLTSSFPNSSAGDLYHFSMLNSSDAAEGIAATASFTRSGANNNVITFTFTIQDNTFTIPYYFVGGGNVLMCGTVGDS